MPSPESTVEPAAIRNARHDLAVGRPWQARDRLSSYCAAHLNERALDLLGDVHAAMGDLPAAGAVWFVLDRTDPLARDAAVAFDEYYGHSRERTWSALPRAVRMGSEVPRVADLRAEFGASRGADGNETLGSRAADALFMTSLFAGCGGLLSAAAVGVVTIIRWIFGGS
ncbi:hypothetical protein EK0264_14505 [Epidermidibacterium keratini]|uniref:Uncharacterized protein n=1 Tax=Epidermidibacterium keratini TaxID=1891644 RepID=A0A7L4YQN9_9ACTN|nr:DUF6584 family protein [Epidermidibacterium keratini]QHC01378.1 hypothetical protein EK0264_14505 [Epidermidibacterium keratini]